ncbi:calcium/sodium antiporter [Akkermansiaceae bacterium]|nr:calcium/sodium antiporter [Akkermansiaceae bacterium]
MSVIEHILWIVGGLALLYFGAEWLVKGASEIALKLGISPLVVGLTVVAFGTSAPELLVSLDANANNQPGMSLGNVIGSNICNIALILGIGALIRPIKVNNQIIKREVPILIIATVLFVVMLLSLGSIDGAAGITHWEGAVLFVGIVTYVVSSLIKSRREGISSSDDLSPEDVENAKKSGAGRVLFNLFLIGLGLFALKFGSEKLVVHGSELALQLGISPAVIALLLIAFGTSLPELATTVVAARKGEGDIIVGNAIGSNIFNILSVVGITALVKPILNQDIDMVDIGVMLGITLLIWPLMRSKMQLSRAEGGFLLAGYLGFCTFLLVTS